MGSSGFVKKEEDAGVAAADCCCIGTGLGQVVFGMELWTGRVGKLDLLNVEDSIVLLLLEWAGGNWAQNCFGIGFSSVFNGLIPCLSYVVNGGKVPPACCRGIKSLYGIAKTTADRQGVCSCLKMAASSVSGIDFKNAAALPGKCGVKNIPFKISPKVDCSKISHCYVDQ
ncbi:non-specific lipid-transfer protein 1-like [Solanum stenotomum]|uniref:non-specific lipid-transfer protein 1-like n=1 Tax=Solanum stenotomum TaxID=172797 RepID=UPI0020D11A66|nr:non-specific lipid-transfer protein 1-like [Solanum stenotomum]